MSGYTLHHGDCLEVMKTLPDNSADAFVTDPPYHLTTGKKGGTGAASVNLESPYGRSRIGTGNGAGGFMGMAWDGGDVAFRTETWTEALRVLKPGGYLLAFSGTRTYHRLACAVEDAGFEIRDQIGNAIASDEQALQFLNTLSDEQRRAFMRCIDESALGGQLAWVFGSGFPKSHNGPWGGTALKPAWEPIVMARKPLIGTVEANWREHGTGALNIDACRVPVDEHADATQLRTMQRSQRDGDDGWGMSTVSGDSPQVVRADGRWPANLIHDGSEEVLAVFPQVPGQSGAVTGKEPSSKTRNIFGLFNERPEARPRGATGSAARFFYCAKASRADRNEGLDDPGPQFKHGSTLRDSENLAAERKGNHHPTVKPTDLMRYLCRLVTPQGGVVLDPFMGSGSTGKAAVIEGFQFIGIEREASYLEIARARIEAAANVAQQQSHPLEPERQMTLDMEAA